MAQEIWHYLENQFDNATKENFRRMNIIIAAKNRLIAKGWTVATN